MKPRPGAVMVREGFRNPRDEDGREEGTPEGKARVGAASGHLGLSLSQIQAAGPAVSWRRLFPT